MPSYHPDTSILNDYAAGSLQTSVAIAVKAHMEMCAECRRQVNQIENTGAFFLESSQSSVSGSLFDRLMNRINQDEQTVANTEAASPATKYESHSGLPTVVQKLLKQPIESINWRKLGKKLRFARIKTGDHINELAMYHILAGGKVPHHRHKSDEITLVLKGSFSDEDGVYRKGDFILRTVGEKHSIAATQNEDCLCLAVQEKPIAFTGLFRLLNPLLKVEAS